MGDDEHDLVGPTGRFHFPTWTKNCWRGRPAGSCWVCKARLVAAPIRIRIRRLF